MLEAWTNDGTDCQYTPTLVLSPVEADWAVNIPFLSITDRTLTLDSSDLALHNTGPYTLTVREDISTTDTNVVGTDYIINIYPVDCLQATIIAPVIDESSAKFLELPDYSDLSNTITDLGDTTGTDGACGTRTLTVTFANGDPLPSWLTVTPSGLVSTVLAQPRGETTQEYDFIVTVASVENSASIASVTTPFTVNMLADCVIVTFSAPTLPTSTVKYIWGSNAVADTLVIPAWTQTPCSYPETRTFVPDLSGYDWISYTSGDLTVSVIKNDGTEEILS